MKPPQPDRSRFGLLRSVARVVRFRLPGLLFALGPLPALIGASPASAQDEDGYRFGVSLGGTSTVALIVERMEGRKGLELTIGTWSFRNLSVSAVGKAYLGPSAFRPAVGAGLWTVVGLRAQEGERKGAALMARFPIGFDWRLAPDHFLDLDVSVNRALWIRRADYSDLPPSPRLIPVPGVSYRMMP
jgi:hypothetical protein